MTISVHLFKQMRSSALQHQIAWFVLKSPPCQTNFEQEPKYRLPAGCCSTQADISPSWVNCIATEREGKFGRFMACALLRLPSLPLLATGFVARCLEESAIAEIK